MKGRNCTFFLLCPSLLYLLLLGGCAGDLPSEYESPVKKILVINALDGGISYGDIHINPIPPAPNKPSGTLKNENRLLCDPCDTSFQCGGNRDFCIINLISYDRFCGLDCSKGQSCPVGSVCLPVHGAYEGYQCIPRTGSCEGLLGIGADTKDAGLGTCPSDDQIKSYVLRRLNEIRTLRSPPLPVLKIDDCLSNLAKEALKDWKKTEEVHRYFQEQCFSIRPNCKCNWQQENSGVSIGGNYSWKGHIDRSLANMMAEEYNAGGHFKNIVSLEWTRVGTAVFCEVKNGIMEIRFTQEFGP